MKRTLKTGMLLATLSTLAMANMTQAEAQSEDVSGIYWQEYTDNIDGQEITVYYYVELDSDHTGTISLQDEVEIEWTSTELITANAAYPYTIEGNTLQVEFDKNGVWQSFEKAPDEEFAEEELKVIHIGDSDYYVSVPAGYELGEMTEEDIADGQIAYYYRGEDEIDFDIYQFPKADEDAGDLLDYVKKEAAVYGVTEGVGEVYRQIGDDLIIYEYQTEEEYEGNLYTTYTYVWENEADYFEIVVWCEKDNIAHEYAAQNLFEEIFEDPAYGRLWLGSTHYTLNVPDYYAGEHDGAEDLFVYMVSDDSSMGFDVYAWDAKEGDTPAAYAKEEAEGKELIVSTINGYEVYSYMDEEESDGITYTTKTSILYDEDGYFAKIVFWLDGDQAAAEADAVLNTLDFNTEDY